MRIESIKALCEAIWEAESIFDLLFWKTNGVYLWQANRMSFYYRLAQLASVLELPKPNSLKGYGKRLEIWTALLSGAAFYNPFIGEEKLDAIIFESTRQDVVDGKRIDIYTHYLAENFSNSAKRYHLLDRAKDGRHIKYYKKERRYLDCLDLLVSLGTRVFRYKMNKEDRDKIAETEDYLSQKIGKKVTLFENYPEDIARFHVERKFYLSLFEKRQPYYVYCVNSYGGMAPMIQAAKEKGITVVELQHGTFSKYHLGYSYPSLPEGEKLQYFPDEFYVWSEFWKSRIRLPIEQSNIVKFGNMFFESQKARYSSVTRKKRQIVVLSQTVIGRRLASLILEASPILSSFQIKYKMHPGEYKVWKSYDALVKLSEMENVQVLTDCDLYQIFAESEYQIGVFSTAIYEGLEFGLKTVLAELPGLEYMEDMLVAKQAITFRQFVEEASRDKLTEQ